METTAITPPTAVLRSFDFPTASSSLNTSSTTATVGNNEDYQEKGNENLLFGDVMVQFRQFMMQKEHAELTRKMEEMTYQSQISGIFAKHGRK